MHHDDATSLRIIDANLNRAREALRVMEEFARFRLEDAVLSAAIKEARHDLARSVPSDLAPRLPACRDIVGDVGTHVSAPQEYERSGTSDVAVAATKRATEALRAIEEYAKSVSRDWAAGVEKIRYRVYDLERRVTLTLRARQRFGAVRLYVLITEALCAGDWFDTARWVLEGGADCLQLREHALPDRELLHRARRLASLCREHDAMLIVNNRPDIAAVSGAHGVHVGQDDLSVADARRIVGPDLLVGVSTHTIEQVRTAASEAPDYIAVGPMFPSPTKPQDRTAGPSTLAEAGSCTSLPLVAIGGINATNAGEVLDAAQCSLCVCQSVVAEPDVVAATRRLASAVQRAQGQCSADT